MVVPASPGASLRRGGVENGGDFKTLVLYSRSLVRLHAAVHGIPKPALCFIAEPEPLLLVGVDPVLAARRDVLEPQHGRQGLTQRKVAVLAHVRARWGDHRMEIGAKVLENRID
jgi:hypothetical protein